jgi:hypothetical protein
VQLPRAIRPGSSVDVDHATVIVRTGRPGQRCRIHRLHSPSSATISSPGHVDVIFSAVSSMSSDELLNAFPHPMGL